MFDIFIQFIAPHHCCVCRKAGTILCKGCMYDIACDEYFSCFGCQAPSAAGVCKVCSRKLPFSAAWVTTQRQGAIKQLLHDYKFARAYAAHQCLAELLDQTIPVLPTNTIVTCVPTIAKHVRLRGYDHAGLIARRFAKQRGLVYSQVLRRKTNSVQVGANKTLRQRQASQAFRCDKKLLKDAPYLIIDDIITTGATVTASAQCLQAAGAKTIMIAAIAR